MDQLIRGLQLWHKDASLDEIELTVPDTLRQMIELQIEMLSPREQLALGAASVHGMVFSAAVTASVLELDEESIEDKYHKLAWHHHMIREGRTGALFPTVRFRKSMSSSMLSFGDSVGDATANPQS
jgi:hypothetical protein